MLNWLLKLFFKSRRTPSIKPFDNKVTQHFESFKRYYLLEHPLEHPNVPLYKEEIILCHYAQQTKKSPYVGDEDFELAKALLKRNGKIPIIFLEKAV